MNTEDRKKLEREYRDQDFADSIDDAKFERKLRKQQRNNESCQISSDRKWQESRNRDLAQFELSRSRILTNRLLFVISISIVAAIIWRLSI